MPSAVACFTFDHLRADAPYREIHSVLERHGIRATFFIEGRDAERDPEAVADIVARGLEAVIYAAVSDPRVEVTTTGEVARAALTA